MIDTPHGLTPIRIDGIPDGYAFERPTMTIAKRTVAGGYTAYLTPKRSVSSPTIEGLLALYKK